MILETPRTILREWLPGDAACAAALYADPETAQWIGDGRPMGPAELQAWIDGHREEQRTLGYSYWALEVKPGTLAGHCGLRPLPGTPDVQVGYAVAAGFRGKGIASEAAAAAVEYGFRVLGLKRIVAVAQPANAGSIAVMKKIGMKEAGSTVTYGKKVVVYEIGAD